MCRSKTPEANTLFQAPKVKNNFDITVDCFTESDREESKTTLIKVKAKNQNENLVCNLKIPDLYVPPEYTAFSHAWGDISNTPTIVCNGKAVQLTQSLYAALRMFAATPLLVWADALSTDRQNIPEKTQ